MSKSELHNWECTIEKLSGNNADKMLDIAQDIYNTAFVRGKNYMSLEQPRWIPVSERLPEDSGEYLVSVIDEYDGNYEAVGVAWFAHKKTYDIKESEWQELGIDETVIAWQPLPEPYKAER